MVLNTGCYVGKETYIKEIHYNGGTQYASTRPDYGNYYLSNITLIGHNMNIKEKFTLALTPEPQKTFRKLGITNGDNILTEEGSKIFQTWLLNKNQDAFKKEVCDPMLVEVGKE